MKPPSRGLRLALAQLDGLTDWERRSRAGMVVGTGPVADLLQRLGQPQQRLPCVHVAGSKGKGTVCALVAAGLRQAGWRVGVYASPHVLRINECVVLDGSQIGDAALAAALRQALRARDAALRAGTAGAGASRFDVLTAAALLAMVQAGCEAAVIEVGLGGRDDSTNVVTPEVAVITSISLEHVEVLGATRAAIAVHKAGIIKPGVDVVCGLDPADEAAAAVAARAQDCAAAVRWVPPAAAASLAQRNLALARAVLDALGRRGLRQRPAGGPVAAEHLGAELAGRVQLPGRMQRVWAPGGVPVVLDGAHVADALRALLDDLQRDATLQGPPTVLLALAADKPADAMLGELRGRCAGLSSCPLPGRACWSAGELAARARAMGIEAVAARSAAAGLRRAAAQAAARGGWVLATGSLHLVAPLLRALRSA